MVEYEYYRLHQQIFQRIGGIVDLPRLAESKVLIVGAGAVGSWITFFLSLSGVGTSSGGLVVIDPDELEIENISRHSVGLPYVSSELSNKAEAVANVIHYRLPVTNIISSDQDFLYLTDEAQIELFQWADLIISAAGHPDVDFRVQQLAFQQQKPAMFPLILSDNDLLPGELAWLVYFLPPPNQTPCLSCLTSNRQARPVEAESALGIDVIHFASVATSYALAILLGETSARARILNRNRNLVLIHNAAPRSPSLEGIINAPFEVKDVRTRVLPNCPICGVNRPQTARPRTSVATVILMIVTAATLLHGGLASWVRAEALDFIQAHRIEAPSVPNSASQSAPTVQGTRDMQAPEATKPEEISTAPAVEQAPVQDPVPVPEPEAQPYAANYVYQAPAPDPEPQESYVETEATCEVIEVIEVVEVDGCHPQYESIATESATVQDQEIVSADAPTRQSSADASVQAQRQNSNVYCQTQSQAQSLP